MIDWLNVGREMKGVEDGRKKEVEQNRWIQFRDYVVVSVDTATLEIIVIVIPSEYDTEENFHSPFHSPGSNNRRNPIPFMHHLNLQTFLPIILFIILNIGIWNSIMVWNRSCSSCLC